MLKSPNVGLVDQFRKYSGHSVFGITAMFSGPISHGLMMPVFLDTRRSIFSDPSWKRAMNMVDNLLLSINSIDRVTRTGNTTVGLTLIGGSPF